MFHSHYRISFTNWTLSDVFRCPSVIKWVSDQSSTPVTSSFRCEHGLSSFAGRSRKKHHRRRTTREKTITQPHDGIHSITEALIDWPAIRHGIIHNGFVLEREPEHPEAGIVIFHRKLWVEAQQNQVSWRCSWRDSNVNRNCTDTHFSCFFAEFFWVSKWSQV